MTQEDPRDDFTGWILLELMGHRREYGHASVTEIAGRPFLRLERFTVESGEPVRTMFFPPDSVYGITVVTEDVARVAYAERSPSRALMAGYEDDEGEPSF